MPEIRQTILPPENFTVRRGRARRTEKTETQSRRSPRAKMGLIPSPELLSLLIDDAIEALARGITWDRGAIVNIVL